jgi:CCAAT/enhancer binding protein (C/EBP)
MYDGPGSGEVKKNQQQGVLSQHIKRYTELADLNSPEISLDLQNLIDDSQFNEGLFTEILNGPKAGGSRGFGPQVVGGPRTTLAYMPQPVHYPEAPVKEEPQEEFR